MASWLKQFFSGDDDKLKDFDQETAGLGIQELRKIGVQSIAIDKIVGSVGRAHELGKDFRYRERAITARYHSIEDALRVGKPMDPIKVFRLQRPGAAEEYYVVDGHHRVAQAKQHGYTDINAEVTDVILLQDDA